MQGFTMVMPIYESNMVDDEEHGRNQTRAKTAKSISPCSLQGGLALPLAQVLWENGIKMCTILAGVGSSRARRGIPSLSLRRVMINSIVFCSVYLLISFSWWCSS